MKAYLVAIALLLPLASSAANSKVEIGQTQEQAIEALGKPQGTIHLGDKTLLLYPEGEVSIRDGVIAEIELMSDKQFAKDQERAKQEHAEWVIQQEKLAADHIEAGEKLKAFKLQSSTFAALPAKDRVDYWRSFQIKFPQVDVSPEIGRALESYQTELAELKNREKIAELETRVALAEKEAASARLETEKIRKETESVSNSEIRIRDYYTTPYNYYYRRPTVIINPSMHKKTHYNQDKLNWSNWDKKKNNNNSWLPTQRSGSIMQNVTGTVNTN
ncbi:MULTISPECIES: hypothetical protein [unclassified Lentimonas]|uniref:hypothetical protein n=1 Tax=unclassified Lentimonas TaxID=2630993 RepID=UPI001324783D|nr:MULTISPECIES: hypothetical protein [unclassified Lentimonas]CAA6679511.1 Unannotated [Lentimonas sp. CC4]CAA6687182.1 Unannotated [Lentimonas sp. CC6]CAA6691605.1 Unannotated [Lentimonas sp. CC10]CAA6696275.1 Unannotated [Lentimonas sp. CC19]CAA7070850.1 Unannotated [Lentimonas sp. CC11]